MYCEDTLFYGIDCNAFYEHYGDSAAGILDILLWTLSWLKMNISGAAIMKGGFPELTPREWPRMEVEEEVFDLWFHAPFIQVIVGYLCTFNIGTFIPKSP